MNARLPLSLRRGACPGLSAPMPTGDGLLVRFVPADAMALDAFTELCAAARAHGNGIIEVTSRGSIQVRGLTPASAPLFATDVARLAIAAADGVAVLAGPLPDDDERSSMPANSPLSCAARWREAVSRLAPKVSVVVDGGGRAASRCARGRHPAARCRTGEITTVAGSARRSSPSRRRVGGGRGPHAWRWWRVSGPPPQPSP